MGRALIRFGTYGTRRVWLFVETRAARRCYTSLVPVVSITRLRLRSWRFVPAFLWYAVRSRMQAMRAEGNRGAEVLREPGNIFWTATMWESEAAVKQYMIAQPHGEAMRRLLNWCNEASVARWTQESPTLPNWKEAHRRMVAEGRRSKVLFPSPAQERFEIPAPKVKG